MRRGFTLVEVLMASMILVLVTGGVLSTFTGLQRLVVNGYETAELSIRMREIREKLLFHAAPLHGGMCYPGVLSGSPVRNGALPIEGGAKIYVSAYATKLTDGSYADATIQLVKNQLAGGGSSFKNDAESSEPYRTRWLSLGNTSYLSITNALDDTRLSTQKNLNKNLYFVNLEASLGEGIGLVRRRERVAIPVFGAEQVKGQSSVFHDTLGGTP